ncbi:RagB/SusD family nutrient uptake outer membrane protein [Pedobacter gandavensis]|uniref:RagB/SusD family nutrient uptake outer membrane protein n=1 Tax=Pedobacter gandavensis TaxID=2679963 RepID=UPI00292EA531|nr:RagB/SusD family nutrient uptake outer membrane protein [Pedobacter gandavensis]
MKTYFSKPGKMIFTLFLVMNLVACKKGFLDKSPLDSVNSTNFFKTASDLQIFVNGFYGRLAPQYNTQSGTGTTGGGNSNLAMDSNTDMMIVQTSITGSLYQWNSNSVAAEADDNWSGTYANIRSDNYFLYYANLNSEKTEAASHYIGEGYFFRAWDYFRLLRNFGGAVIITDLLNDNDTEKLFAPRSTRYEVAKQIMADLDLAISKLHWKGEGQGTISGRVTKDAALALKARIALYEGSWEYYHSRKASPYAMPGKNGNEFLEMVETTVSQLINRHGAKIFTAAGDKLNAYNQLFAQKNAANIDGVFLYKVYDAALLTLSHNFFFKILDSGPSITDHLTDTYLNKDGTAQVAAPANTLNQLSTNLDPRFRQTVWTPDRGPLNQLPGRGGDGDPFRYPIIASQAPYTSIGFTSTGYRNYKGAVLAQEATKGETDDILMRYEESLLSLAEAKAILGTINQADIDKTVNVIRNRVGMAPLSLNALPATTYREDLGFDLSSPAIVNEIRRERTVEFALEGFRLNDLKRWAVYEKVINGYQPKGALLQESLDYFNRTPAQLELDKGSNAALYSQIRKDGYMLKEFNLINGENVASFPNGRINPWFKQADFRVGGRGLYINPVRDYLSAIPLQQIKLYQTNNAVLSQNPGWN